MATVYTYLMQQELELSNSVYASASAGVSVEFDTTGALLGDAVDGINGAYTSLNGDVGSPGNLTPNTNAGELTLNGRIYPNPNTGMFKIEMNIKDNYTVQVMDVRGAILSKIKLEGIYNSFKLTQVLVFI